MPETAAKLLPAALAGPEQRELIERLGRTLREIAGYGKPHRCECRACVEARGLVMELKRAGYVTEWGGAVSDVVTFPREAVERITQGHPKSCRCIPCNELRRLTAEQ